MTSRTLIEHFAAVQALARPLPALDMPVSPAITGRVLAADAIARLPIPPFSNSAMDGFVIRSADLVALRANPSQPVTFPVAGDVPAGSPPRPVPEGQALRIMTGAPVEESAAGSLQVIPVELTDSPAGPAGLPSHVTVQKMPPRNHIRPRGENLMPGDIVGKAGTVIDAGTLAGLVSAGVPTALVHRAPAIAIVTSGDELVHNYGPHAKLGPGQLPDSNGPMLAALVHAAYRGFHGLEQTHWDASEGSRAAATESQPASSVVTLAHCGDSPERLSALLDSLAGSHDLILTSGGVSVGAFDVVHATLSTQCPDAWFGHVDHKPGAPQGVATWSGTPVIALPGNPVAAFVSFHLYVSPFLKALRGLPVAADPWARPRIAAAAAGDFPQPRPGRLGGPGKETIVPVRLDFSSPVPTATAYNGPQLGSHLVASLAGTHAFVRVTKALGTGDTIDCYLY